MGDIYAAADVQGAQAACKKWITVFRKNAAKTENHPPKQKPRRDHRRGVKCSEDEGVQACLPSAATLAVRRETLREAVFL